MKFRRDYVTNSSSSSYTCEICGRTESGGDVGLSECGMMECVNGHVFCCDESLDVDSKELVKLIMENEWNTWTQEELMSLDKDDLIKLSSDGGYYDVPECVCPICNFIEYSEFDLSAYLLKEYKISRDEVFAEVKALNKRRKKLYEIEYITYVCKKFDLNPAEIVSEWKERFSSYSEFKEYLKNKSR